MGPRRPLFNLSPQKGSEAPAPAGTLCSRASTPAPLFPAEVTGSRHSPGLPRPQTNRELLGAGAMGGAVCHKLM